MASRDPFQPLQPLQDDDDFGFVANSQTSSAPSIAPPRERAVPPPPPQVQGPGGQVPDFQGMAEIPQGSYSRYQSDPGAFRGETMGGALEDFGFNALQNPSRFDMPLVQQGIDVINAAIDKQRNKGKVELEEHAASRGIVGSSVEADNRRLFEEELQRQNQERLFDLNMAQAQTLANDRGVASQIGLNIGEFGRELGADRETANRYGFEANRMVGRDQEDDLRARAQMAMEAGDRQEAARLNRSADELARASFGFGAGLETARFSEGQRQFDATRGLSQQQLDLEADRLAQDAQQFGASLDFEQARFGAEIGLQRQQLDQRESEFARTIGLSEREFVAENQRFAAEHSEAIASRIQQENQFQRSLNETAAGRVLEGALRGRALDLQQQGMGLDEAFRRAELDVDRTVRNRALDLEAQGMQREDAYKYAALEQDATFTARAQNLQALGMQVEDSYRRAALEQEAWGMFQQLKLEAQQTGDQSRLAELDIVLRGIASLGTGDESSERTLATVLGSLFTNRTPQIQAPPSFGGGAGGGFNWNSWQNGGSAGGGSGGGGRTNEGFMDSLFPGLNTGSGRNNESVLSQQAAEWESQSAQYGDEDEQRAEENRRVAEARNRPFDPNSYFSHLAYQTEYNDRGEHGLPTLYAEEVYGGDPPIGEPVEGHPGNWWTTGPMGEPMWTTGGPGDHDWVGMWERDAPPGMSYEEFYYTRPGREDDEIDRTGWQDGYGA